MKIIKIPHFKERLTERAHCPGTVLRTFENAIVAVKKKKIHPEKLESQYEHNNQLYKLFHKGCYFIYFKKKGKYILVTFYQIKKTR